MMKNSTREGRVAEFNNKAENKTFADGGSVGKHLTNFAEELAEFNHALADYVTTPSEENRKKMIKEWADAQFTLSSFPWFYDFDATSAFNRVADSNMTKVENGPLVNEVGKVLKGPNYVAPDMFGL